MRQCTSIGFHEFLFEPNSPGVDDVPQKLAASWLCVRHPSSLDSKLGLDLGFVAQGGCLFVVLIEWLQLTICLHDTV